MRRIKAIRQLLCSHCMVGALFSSRFKMNERCAHCGILFEREPGYFLMAIFVAYLICLVLIAPLYLFLYWLRLSLPIVMIIFSLFFILIAPFVFQYARAVWLHLDELLDPREE